MSPSGDGNGLNEQFLATLADELSEAPVSEMLDGLSAEDAQQLAARWVAGLVMSSKEEAGHRWLLTYEQAGHDDCRWEVTTLLGRRNTLTESPRDGAVYFLTVKGLTDFGAVVDRGDGIECVLHITDLAWSSIKHPADVIKVGARVDMRILYIRKELLPPQDGPQMRPEPQGSVSRRAVVEQELSAERSALMEKLQEGAVVCATVKNLTDYGAFVDVGGIDGLLHITDMAWKRIKHPSEVVKVGDEIDVRILKLNPERSRVSVGLKQLMADPWENISRRYPPNTRVFGKVTNIADYGAFVEIEEGVEGLVHVSEMDWTNKNVNPAKVVHTGQEVEVMVLDVDEERRRISLGLKQCRPVEQRTSP